MWKTIQFRNIRGIALLTALVSAAAFIACLSCNATAAEEQKQAGTFKVVGVGPGDGDLLTLRAVKAIEDAEVVFCSAKRQEKLSSAIDFNGKEVIDGYGVLFWHYGKKCKENEKRHPKQRMSCEEYHSKQAEFAQKVRESVAEGKDVVMLSSGDPTIYGPDIWTLRELSELDTELIPGLSAFNAANAALKASLGEVMIT
ncbi:MAG: tetrapyrrole methylase, partial [Candidatus Electrothrix sp. AS4_5]|nr:tetrapyrrole methylase [Candidatus Electrothrix gigas]